MSNSWLRLWHEMPNDPKWRTIARVSGQPISLVVSTYLHLIVDASRNVTRGHVTVTNEDIASALDVTEEQIEKILSAMQGRVMDGEKLTGWDKRQPKREDSGDSESGAKSAAERKRAQREREKMEREQKQKEAGEGTCHDVSRNVTTDKDKDTENNKTILSESVDSDLSAGKSNDETAENEIPQSANVVKIGSAKQAVPYQSIMQAYNDALPELSSVRMMSDQRKQAIKTAWVEMLRSKREDGSPRYTDTETGIRWWTAFFNHARTNPHWMGKNDRGWTATFDWLLKNRVKVIEYEARESA